MTDNPTNPLEHRNVLINLQDRRKAKEIGDVLESGTNEINETYDTDSFENGAQELNKINSKHALVLHPEGYREPMVLTYVENLEDEETHSKIKFISTNAFKAMYCNQSVSANNRAIELGVWWLKNFQRKEYRTTFFDPKKPPEYKNGFNLWQGYGTVPAQGDWKLIRKHIYKILCNCDHEKFKYVMRWFAWCIQNPDQQAEVALVFKGMQGCGKGTIFSAFVKIFGNHGAAVAGAGKLTGRFNKFIRTCVFLFADEAFTAGDKESEAILKSFITEKKITIEGKGQDLEIGINNRLHVVMASNEEWVVPASSDSRRFFINECDNRYAKGQASYLHRKMYFDAVFKQLNSGGTEAMLYDLLKYKLNKWHPRENVPMTKEMATQQEISLPRIQKGYLEFLKEGIFPCPPNREGEYVISMQALFTYICELYPHFKTISTQKVATTLVSYGVGKRRGVTGNLWIFPRLSELRKHWNDTQFSYEFDAPNEWRHKTYMDKGQEIDF